MRLSSGFFTCLMAVTAFATAASQPVLKIEPGDRIRLSAPSLGTAGRIGILTKAAPDQLSLVDPGPNGAAWVIDLKRVETLEVRRTGAGNRRHRGALIGMITGFVAFGAIGYVATHCPNGCDFDGMGVMLAGPGGGIGALIGFRAGRGQKTDGWVRVPLPLEVKSTGASEQNLRLLALRF